MDEYDVAVVVFCRTTGADESDAADRASYAVRHTLGAGKTVVPIKVPLPESLAQRLDSTDPVRVASVTPLRYVGGQGIRLVATAEPYQNAGMGKPRKGQG